MTCPHPRTSSPALALAFALASLAVGGPALASEEPPAGFGDMVNVRLVNIEAVVTGRGEPIHGLKKEEFRLLVDGEEVPIEYFSEIRQGAAIEGPRGAESAALAPVTPGEEVVTRYLLFIDDEFTVPSRRNSVLRRLSSQLSLLGPRDRVAVVAWDGRQVEMLSSWRPGDEAARAVLRRAMERPAYGLQRRSEWSRWRSELRFNRRSPAGGSSFSTIGFSGASRGSSAIPVRELGVPGRVGRLGWALTSALRGFAQPDGRKVVLFLSGGLPPLEGDLDSRRFAQLERIQTEDRLRRLFAPAVETANRLGYSIYPVDLGSLDSRGASAESSGLAESLVRREISRQDERTTRDTFLYMSESTGGRSLFQGARLTALERVVEDTRSYYWLGFSPAWREDDSPHDVKVELRDPRRSDVGRLRVRSRTGFHDLSRRARLVMQVESAHLFELPLPAEGQLRVEAGEKRPAERGKIVLPVEIRIPVETLTFLPAGDDHSARVELRIAATDDRGNSADIPVVEIEIPRRAAIDGEYLYSTGLELRRRAHRLLFAVHDPLGDGILAARLEYDPSDAKP